MSRNIARVSRRLITNILQANGIDPKALKGAEKIYGVGAERRKIRITREESKKIKQKLASGELVVLRPTSDKAKRSWEFVAPENVVIKTYHGHNSKRPITSDKPTAPPVVKKSTYVHFSNKHVSPEDKERALRIGKVLLAIREKDGRSQTNLAKTMSVHNSDLSYWERGIRLPSTSALSRIAHYVNERPALSEFKDQLINAAREMVLQ